ncbi:energy-coupling factor transporter transmembrane component T family protein [Staphylococcus lutrae]|uniref:Energy-coupling factor transporter transmembrane protein EcfT n=1 Tax=Staphylococcus lutrae TaxID=155085 RepID=A0AAC9RNH4_9STAP|nr:energy-coupling factor transporter transmembrane protein EcfT [Staphylococcus lutrae]ARJ50376.1 transporter [Staphylococcus lutrae]PNZ38722.1 energy-coupling factor transporter transmembrane protein EcfT [Staphylococcus lutrae]
MKDKMIIGRYLPLDTMIHRLDPRSKLIFVFLFIIIIFMGHHPMSYLWLALVLGVMIRLARIPFWFLIKGLSPVFFFLILTLIMHLFLTKGGTRLFEWGIISIDTNGIREGILILFRLSLIMIASTVLTLTTSPLNLTDAFDRLFKPLKYIKVPVAALSMMMAIALRFIPTLMEELDKIILSQKSRGSDMSSGSLMTRIRAFIPLLIPLFISAFQRAEELAIAMEVRGYDAQAERTSYRILKWQARDTWLIVSLVPIAAVSLWLSHNF